MTTTDLLTQIVAAHTRDATRTQEGPTGDDERWTIVLERDYDHPRDEVWACWTEPDRLARWLGRIDRQPAVGETVRMTMSPEAAQDIELVGCEPRESLTVRWGGFGEGESRVRVTFADTGAEGSATRVRLEHSGLRAHGAWSYGAGWGEVLHLAALAVADPSFDLVTHHVDHGAIEEGLQRYWDHLVPTGRAG